MFNIGDTVKFKTGTVEYEVERTEGDMVTVTKSQVATATGYERLVRKTAHADRLVLVQDAYFTSADNDPFEEVPPKEPAETVNVVVRDEVPVHIPGESPAAYRARTSHKLDGRRTALGRSILSALQAKLAPQFRKTKIGRKARKLAQEGV
jgi:hypothetical protein